MTRSIALLDHSGRLDVTADAVLPIYSLTKTFIAAAIVALQIDVREPIATWMQSEQEGAAHEHLLALAADYS